MAAAVRSSSGAMGISDPPYGAASSATTSELGPLKGHAKVAQLEAELASERQGRLRTEQELRRVAGLRDELRSRLAHPQTRPADASELVLAEVNPITGLPVRNLGQGRRVPWSGVATTTHHRRRWDLTFSTTSLSQSLLEERVQENLFLTHTLPPAAMRPRQVVVRDYTNSCIINPFLASSPKKATKRPSVRVDGEGGPPLLPELSPGRASATADNLGASLGLHGRPSHPLPGFFNHKSARRCRHYADYKGRLHLVDLQDPPDQWVARP
eukprot:RCo039540